MDTCYLNEKEKMHLTLESELYRNREQINFSFIVNFIIFSG